MQDKMFEAPVFVDSGPEAVTPIASINDALDFLDEYPMELRDMLFDVTERACRAAHDGLYPLQAAREAFAGWAKRSGLLSQAQFAGWMLAGKMGRGGVKA